MERAASKPFVYHNRDNSNDAFQCLAEFREQGLLCDILLCVENKKIRAHRVILAAASPYFRAMFLGKLAESNQHRVVLYDFDATAIELIVQYAYTGVVEIDEFNVQSVLYASALLQIDKVKQACCEFLLKVLDVCNCLGIRSLAESLSCHELFEIAHQFVVDHFGDVLKQEEFLFQPYESLKCLLDSKFLNTSSEEEVLSGVLAWLNFCPSERQAHAHSLLKRSCLMKVAPDFLSNLILEDSIVQASSECQQLILETLEAMKSSNLRDAFEFPGILQRSCRTGCEILLTIGGESGGVTVSSCQCFGQGCSSWSWDIPGRFDDSMPLACMNNGRTYMAVASTGNQIYVVGGHSSWKVLDSVERYEWPGNKWCQLSPLLVDRMGAGATVLEDQPIVIGGYSKTSGYLSSVEMYDHLIDSWTFITPMRATRSYLGGVALGEAVYAIGGVGGERGNSDDWLTSVESLEPQRGMWLPVAPLSQPRAYLGAVQKDGRVKFYIFQFSGCQTFPCYRDTIFIISPSLDYSFGYHLRLAEVNSDKQHPWLNKKSQQTTLIQQFSFNF